jgi:uncharacterized membrane protein
MAGVGLSIRRQAERGGLLGPLGAFGYAGLLAAGPYVCASLGIFALGLSSGASVTREGLALMAYATVFSMLAFAPFQFASARILGDLLYEGRTDAFSAVLVQLLGPLLGWLTVSGVAFLACVPCAFAVKVATFALYLALGGTWLAMVPLSAAKGYRAIAAIFITGILAACLGAHFLAGQFGLVGLLAGLALGQGAIFVALLWRCDSEFGAPTRALDDLGARLLRHGALVVAGGAYGLALTLDRLIFWWHAAAPGVAVLGPVRVCPLYDNGMSLAALTTVPALALFLVLAETDLARGVGRYFATLEARASFETLERARQALVRISFENLVLLALVQGTLTLGVVVFAPELVSALKLPWLSMFVFRIGAVGAFFQVLLMATLVHLLYLDRVRQTAALAVLFLVANGLFTLGAMSGGLPAFGFGFTAAAALTLGVALAVLEHALSDLHATVFRRQPL